jgi:DNA-binding CsgD family transcriptional regulator
MTALNEIVPASNGQFYWANLNLEVANCYMDGPCLDLVPLYLSEFCGTRKEHEVRLSFAEMMRAPFPSAAGYMLPRCFKVDWNTLVRSDYYDALGRPFGMNDGIFFKVSEARRPVGAFQWFRSTGEPPFAQRDFALLEALHGFIAHGLVAGPAEDSWEDTEDRALVILDGDGRLLHLSPDAHRLLLMALVPRWGPDTAARMRLGEPEELVRLCRLLTAASSSRLPAAPPVLRRTNAWGEFVLRAYWLDAPRGEEPSRLVGIMIERREPRSLGLLRRVEALPLSRREKELCLLLAHGHDAGNAASALGVTEHTVISHRRSIYNKLGVENRWALIERLRAE